VNELKKLDAKTALAQLQNLKQGSATGATGLGALSEKEMDILINSFTALNPLMPAEDAARELATIADYSNRMKIRLQFGEKMLRKYGVEKGMEILDSILEQDRPEKITSDKWRRYKFLKVREAAEANR
jgi:hypothetical protein